MSAASSGPVHPVALKIDAETKARLKRLAEAKQRTPHWLMREAVAQYIDREERREQAELWLQENAAELASSNDYVARHGLPLDRYRQF